MTSSLQPLNQIVCINKTLAFFFFFFWSNASRSMSHICAWNSGQWSWQNVIYLHWNLPDPWFTFPAFQSGFHIHWPFWTIRERANFHGLQISRAWQVGGHFLQLARSSITQEFFHRRRKNTAIHFMPKFFWFENPFTFPTYTLKLMQIYRWE